MARFLWDVFNNSNQEQETDIMKYRLEREENIPENKNPIAQSVEQSAPCDRPDSKGLFFPALGQGQMDSERSEKRWASWGHLTSLAGIPMAGLYVVGPLIIFLMKRGQSPFVDEHIKETLNFSIVTTFSIWISGVIGFFACFVWAVTVLLGVMNFIYCIQGFCAARKGQGYRYPFNFRIIK